jgi:hypothetical protein
VTKLIGDLCLYCSSSSSGFWHHVDLKEDASVLEKLIISIFRTEVAMLGSGGFMKG